MRRTLLSGLTLVGALALLAGNGTLADFLDSESSTGNSLTAGTLDLTVDGNNGTAATGFQVGGLEPGDSVVDYVVLQNVGNEDGVLGVDFGDPVNLENGCGEPEIEDGDPCGVGDLGSQSRLEVAVSAPQAGAPADPSALAYTSMADSRLNPTVVLFAAPELLRLGAGESVVLRLTTSVCGNGVACPFMVVRPFSIEGATDMIQSDSVSFDIDFTLRQVDPGTVTVLP